MRSVYVLQHSYELGGCDETKFIGVYSTRRRAQAAVRRLRRQPGFRDRPNDFHIDEYAIDRDHWVEGFFTMRGGRRVPTPRAKARSRVRSSNQSLERTRGPVR